MPLALCTASLRHGSHKRKPCVILQGLFVASSCGKRKVLREQPALALAVYGQHGAASQPYLGLFRPAVASSPARPTHSLCQTWHRRPLGQLSTAGVACSKNVVPCRLSNSAVASGVSAPRHFMPLLATESHLSAYSAPPLLAAVVLRRDESRTVQVFSRYSAFLGESGKPSKKGGRIVSQQAGVVNPLTSQLAGRVPALRRDPPLEEGRAVIQKVPEAVERRLRRLRAKGPCLGAEANYIGWDLPKAGSAFKNDGRLAPRA